MVRPSGENRYQEMANRIFGPNALTQSVNQAARTMSARAQIHRRERMEGKIGNYLVTADSCRFRLGPAVLLPDRCRQRTPPGGVDSYALRGELRGVSGRARDSHPYATQSTPQVSRMAVGILKAGLLPPRSTQTKPRISDWLKISIRREAAAE